MQWNYYRATAHDDKHLCFPFQFVEETTGVQKPKAGFHFAASVSDAVSAQMVALALFGAWTTIPPCVVDFYVSEPYGGRVYVLLAHKREHGTLIKVFGSVQRESVTKLIKKESGN